MKLIAGLSAGVLALFLASLHLGAEPIDVAAAARDWLMGGDSVASIILFDIRLPRALLAVVVGASLGLCGAAMQGCLHNPLATPGLIGSSSGAALAVVSVLYFTAGGSANPLLPLVGGVGALSATALVWLLAGSSASVATLILAGVAINALATALMALLLNLAPSPWAVRELLLWTLGDLSDRSLDDLLRLLPATALGWALLIGVGRQLDALTLGERSASSLGVDPRRLRWRVFLAAALAVGAAVSVSGMIGFVGLAVPHLLRPWVGHRPGRLLWTSALGGAAMLLAADIGVRLIDTPVPLKIGVLTALVGGPFFLHLVLRSRRVLI